MNKMLALIMALVMMILPMAGMAEAAKYDVALNVDPVALILMDSTMEVEDANTVTELINSIGLSFTAGENAGQMEITLGGNQVVTVAGSVVDDRLYLTSNLLGDRTISMNQAETKTVMARIMCMTDSSLTMEDALAQVDTMVDSFTEGFNVGYKTGIGMMDVDAIMNGFDTAKVTALTMKVMGILGKATNENVTDETGAAVNRTRIVITGEELKDLLIDVLDLVNTNAALMDIINNAAAAQGTEANVDALIEQLKNTTGGEDLVVDLDVAEDGSFVRASINDGKVTVKPLVEEDMNGFSVLFQDEENPFEIDILVNETEDLVEISMIMGQQTLALSVDTRNDQAKIVLAVLENGELEAEIDLVVNEKSMTLSMSAPDMENIFVLKAEVEDENKMTIKVTLAGIDVATLTITSSEAAEPVLDTAGALAIGTLDDAAWGEFVNGVYSDFSRSMANVLGLLN